MGHPFINLRQSGQKDRRPFWAPSVELRPIVLSIGDGVDVCEVDDSGG
jgi:hypothetical protein